MQKKATKEKQKMEGQRHEPVISAPSAFEKFAGQLQNDEKAKLDAFFSELSSHCFLPTEDNAAIRRDFENAIMYYKSAGVSLSSALFLLDIRNMGGFYARPATAWYALDDAAKVYPLSMKHGQMAVFRVSAYMKDDVVPEILQIALTFTIKRFPSFATVVKSGFFWHYLDASKGRYELHKDGPTPCRPIAIGTSGVPAFRVLYYNNRISAEFFHIITDGTGGMSFLRTLVCEYIRLRYGVFALPAQELGILNINDAPNAQEIENAFLTVEKKERASGFLDKPAVQLGGELSYMRPCRVIHLLMNADDFAMAAKRNGVTVTAYALALIFIACRGSIDVQTGDICVQVPVNMRKYYPSKTLRNFAMYCKIRLGTSDITDIPSTAKLIAQQLEKKASKQAMNEMLCATGRLVSSVRFVPLFVKTFFAKIGYGYMGEAIFTNTLSNLGIVRMPKNVMRYVKSFDVVLGTTALNRAACSLVTYNGVSTLTISKNTLDPSFEDTLYLLLRDESIACIPEGSE